MKNTMKHRQLYLYLLFCAVVPRSVSGHFFWAETDQDADHLTVAFSEHAGVPDKVVERFADRVETMAYHNGDTTKNVALALNEENNLLEGNLPGLYPPGPAFVSGYLDNGPYERFKDVQFSFGAQIYDSEADYDGFFRPLLRDVGYVPTIVMRNCGGSPGKGSSYQFDVAGLPSQGPFGVCLYRKGGILLDCGTFSPPQVQEPRGEDAHGATPTSVDRFRRLRGRDVANGDRGNSYTMNLSMDSMSIESLDEPSLASPNLIYALANQTVVDDASGDISIYIASTSVYFQGPCQADF